MAAGDLLFEIDPEEHDLMVRDAEVQLRQAEAPAPRYQPAL